MNNKVLVKLIVPEIDSTFDVFVPVNEIAWKIKKMLIKCINDITGSNFVIDKEYILIKKENGRIYKNNEILIDTDIRNATELILISSNQESEEK